MLVLALPRLLLLLLLLLLPGRLLLLPSLLLLPADLRILPLLLRPAGLLGGVLPMLARLLRPRVGLRLLPPVPRFRCARRVGLRVLLVLLMLRPRAIGRRVRALLLVRVGIVALLMRRGVTRLVVTGMLARGGLLPLGLLCPRSLIRLRLPRALIGPLRRRLPSGLLAGDLLASKRLTGNLLARHLLARIAEHRGLRPLSIGNDALAVLMRYGWPGNVRQLAGVLFRAALQCEGTSLTAEHFPHIAIQSRFSGRKSDQFTEITKTSADAAMAGQQLTLYRPDGHLRSMEELEADIIRLAIGHYRGRMTEVARRLGIGRSTLYRKLGELGIDTAA